MFKKVVISCFIMLFSLSVFSADFTVQKLPNGQTLIVKEEKNNPIVTIDTWVKTGSINENDKNSGVSHFLEHLFFKGTKLHPAGDFDRILESKGAVVNAATSKDFTHYYITIPSEYFDISMELHSDMLTNPQIPRKELESERKVVLEEISKDENTPSKIVYENLNDLMYSTHPYRRRVIGSADVISTIRREEILDYFNKWYSPSNMITIVVGDVDTQKVIKKVSQCFHSEFKKSEKTVYKKEHPITSQRRKTEYLDANSGYLMIGFRGEPISNSETYALDVLSQVLGGGKSSRLYRNIKEQKGLVYNIGASNGSYRDDGIFYITANFNPVNNEKLEKAIFDEIKSIHKYGITQEELNIAKKVIEQETYYSRESTSNIASELGYTVTLTDNADFYNNYLANINKVNVKDVQLAAQKYLSVNKSAVSLILPESVKNKEVKSPVKHAAALVSESNGIIKYVIDNKTTMLVNPHKNNDIIAISIFAKGGEFLENKIGEATVMAKTMLKGTNKYSYPELVQLMEENGIKIIPSSGEDYFAINVQTTTAQIDLTMEILDEIINNSIFDDYEIEKTRTEILGKIKQHRDVPMNVALENFKTMLYEGSVYSNTNKILEKYLPNITRADILSFYKKIFDAKNVIVSVNGDVDSDYLIQKFGSFFYDRKTHAFDYKKYKVTKLVSPKEEVVSISDLQTAWLFWGWQTDEIQNTKDFVTLKLLNTILGGGMNSRIYRNLREQDGLAYQLGASYSAKELGGTFVTYIGTNPQTLDYSKKKLAQEVDRLKREFVSDAELKDAKSRLKGSFIVAMETNAEKASVVGNFETLGLGYDFLDKYIKMIDEVTVSDIMRVANKYFTNINVESIVTAK